MKTLLGLAFVLGSIAAAAAQGYGPRSPYTSGNGVIVDQNGTYRGNANGNPYDLNSVSNPLGRYGSPLASEVIRRSLITNFGVKLRSGD